MVPTRSCSATAPSGTHSGTGEKITFPFRAGATVIYRDRPSAAEMWSLLIEHQVTTLAANATMYRMMLATRPTGPSWPASSPCAPR